jgi:hypothetical protein
MRQNIMAGSTWWSKAAHLIVSRKQKERKEEVRILRACPQ